ncbi:MAG TPA: diguanylate cyclase [Terracidiphilus sp.]|nr:diguanylate cyclase [Terracidiphilus sp.]
MSVALRRRSSLVACVLASLVWSAQVMAQEYRFENFGANEGLANLAVKNVMQDQEGYLWVSTEAGVFRFDGERFQAFGKDDGLPESSGVSFGRAPDGSLLAGGEIGLFRKSGNRFEPVRLPGSNTVSWVGGLESDSSGRTYVATDSGLVVLTGNSGGISIRSIPPPKGVSDHSTRGLWIDGEAVWYGCGKQVCRLSNGDVRVFGDQRGLAPTQWVVLGDDKEGSIWVRGRSVGLATLARGATRFQFVEGAPLPHSGVSGIACFDSDGDLLFPSPDGLAIHHRGQWKTIGPAQGLRGVVYSVFQDREGSIWLGMAGHGLVRWAGYKQWAAYTVQSGLGSDLVYQMLPAEDGTLWVGTEAGLYRGTPRSGGYSWLHVRSLAKVPVHSVQRDDSGMLWLGTETLGVARLNPATGGATWFRSGRGLKGGTVSTMLIDHEKRVWSATEKGLYETSPPYSSFHLVNELPGNQFWALAEGANGQIWAGGSSGLFHLSGSKWRNFTVKDGISRNEILALAMEGSGEIWVGYRFGGEIDKVTPVAAGIRVTHILPQRRGGTRLVYFLGFDARKRLWAGTEHGVNVFDGATWSHMDMNDGLVWDDCDLNGFAVSPDGTVWIGTSGGLARFTPSAHASQVFPYSVVLTKIVLAGRPHGASDHPSVDYKFSHLEVQFSDLKFTRKPLLQFRYRLLPLFGRWRQTDHQELEFPSLPPGQYKLEVQAQNPSGRWNPDGAAFSFEVRSPWFRTWWFLGLSLLAAMAVALTLNRLRMHMVRRREQELHHLVTLRTAELRTANEELYRLSTIDGLTGAANRRTFDQALEAEFARLYRTEDCLSLLLLDVDHFKILNDTEGHQYGDWCLVQVATALRGMARRETDLVARYGGEEFALVLPGMDAASALEFAERVRRSIALLALRNVRSPILPVLTVSIGVGTVNHGDEAQSAAFLAAVDRALYAAKERSRNCVAVAWPPFSSSKCEETVGPGNPIHFGSDPVCHP